MTTGANPPTPEESLEDLLRLAMPSPEAPWCVSACPYGFGRHKRDDPDACDVCKRDVVIAQLRSRLLLAEREAVELEEARAVWERWAKEMERRNIALQESLALAERQLASRVTVAEEIQRRRGAVASLSAKLALAERALEDHATQDKLTEDVVRAARVYAIWHSCQRRGGCFPNDALHAALDATSPREIKL